MVIFKFIFVTLFKWQISRTTFGSVRFSLSSNWAIIGQYLGVGFHTHGTGARRSHDPATHLFTLLLSFTCCRRKLFFNRLIYAKLLIFKWKRSASGPSCSKLTTSLVNVSLKFQMQISEIRQYLLLKTFRKLLQCKSFSHFFQQKYQYIWL